MDNRLFIVLMATTLTYVVTFVVAAVLEISPPLLEWVRSTGPVAACISAVVAVDIWERVQKRRATSRETQATAGFIGEVMDIAVHWSSPLAIGSEALATCRRSFESAVDARNEVIEDLTVDVWDLFVVCERIVELSLRTTDSVLSLLRTGHPDTAMGVARTLFELSVNLQIISLDKTGQRAARFREFQEGEFLENLQSVPDKLSNQGNLDRLLELREKYAYKKKFPRNSNAWIIKEDGKPLPGGMPTKVEYLHRESGYSGHNLRSGVMRTWVWLNQWAHGTQVSAYRRIAARNEGGYLVGKRDDGLNTPMLIAFVTLQGIMMTYIELVEDLTDGSLDEERGTLRDLIAELKEALSGVAPELLNHDIGIVSRSELASREQT